MRLFSIIFTLSSFLFITACGSGPEINGRNFKTALKSVKSMRKRLPQEQRIAFELSFWTLRSAYRKNSEFLDIVGGTTAEQLIQQGKTIFEQRKAEGFPEYQQYSNWDTMIAKYSQDQKDQTIKRKKSNNSNSTDNNILYSL